MIETIMQPLDIMALLLSLIAGAGVGFVYFFGLWLTIKQLAQQKNPGLLMLASLVVRTALVMVVFYQIMQTVGWQGLFAALAGLVMVRLVLSRCLAPAGDNPPAGSNSSLKAIKATAKTTAIGKAES